MLPILMGGRITFNAKDAEKTYYTLTTVFYLSSHSMVLDVFSTKTIRNILFLPRVYADMFTSCIFPLFQVWMTINEGDPALRGTARSHPPPDQGHSASDLALSFPRTHLWPLRHRPGLKLSYRLISGHSASYLALSFPGLTFGNSASGLA